MACDVTITGALVRTGLVRAVERSVRRGGGVNGRERAAGGRWMDPFPLYARGREGGKHEKEKKEKRMTEEIGGDADRKSVV